MAAHASGSSANFGADYVIVFRFPETGKGAANKDFEKLVRALCKAGLQVEVRNGSRCSLLVFVRVASQKHLTDAAYRSRTRDWLHGIRADQPDKETKANLAGQPLSEAEQLRISYHMITGPAVEGGAAIIPKTGGWKHVESIFPLHDYAYNKEWIKNWSTKTFLKADDLDEIRNRLGEKIAFYFAFTQSYFSFLFFPALFGFSCWVLLGHFSPIYAIVNGLWCIVFIEYWRTQERDLSIRWGVKGVSAIQEKRKEFRSEKEIKDPITGETLQVFPATKRLYRQLLQIPFAIIAVVALGSIIAVCFGIEIFLDEVYNGPFKNYLVYLPTVLLTGLIPTMSTLLLAFATRLNDFENWETQESYQYALTSKIFIENFIISYLPILLTAFVYVPFGRLIVPYLDVFQLTARPFAENEKQLQSHGFKIDSGRLQKQVIYFTVTAQIVNFAMETIVPYVKRKAFNKYNDMRSDRAAKQGGAAPEPSEKDHPEEASFLSKVRNESELAVYDVTDDLREMVVQFGYLALFSVVWPLTAVSFLINNWIELRSDAVKICVEMQRPIPYRADGIGPWLESLGFLTWFGSITTAALVYLFRNDGLGPEGTPGAIQGWALMLSIFFSEHIYLLVRWSVRFALSKVESPETRKERAERYLIRKRYLEESLGENPIEATCEPEEAPEKITHESLEEDARAASLTSSSPNTRFWARQKGWEESARVGAQLIEQLAPREGKKQQ